MSRLFPPLLVAGLVIAGLGAATAVSIFEEDGLQITVVDKEEKSDDLVDDEALDGVTLRTAEPATPSPGPARLRSRRNATPVTEAASGPRGPRATRDRAEAGGATNPPGSGDRAVGVGPDINDGQGLPADPTKD